MHLVVAVGRHFGDASADRGQSAGAAIEAGCDTLLGEDMQDGRVMPELRIVNPLT